MRLTEKTLREQQYKRLTFEIRKNEIIDRSYTLTLNPEEMTQREPTISEVTLTLGGAYVEDWGAGLPEITIKGTTGYSKKTGVDGVETDGVQEFQSLRNDIFRYFLEPNGRAKRTLTDTYELRFYNWADSEFYIIQPRPFSLMRSKSRPLLYAYEWSFTCLRKLGQKDNTNQVVIPYSSEDSGSLLTRINTAFSEGLADANTLLGGN